MKDSGEIILAIESAICGGSISLLRNGDEIANWTGTSNVSKAEELLVNIDALLTANNISRNEIGLIAVSAGPGSFTGIRIGLATALGLKAGLGIEMSSESALKAMAFMQADGEKICAAVPMGRSAVCLQTFKKTSGEFIALDEAQTMPENEFLSMAMSDNSAVFVLHAALFEKAASARHITNFGANIAYAIGLICRANAGVVTEPLFISKNF